MKSLLSATSDDFCTGIDLFTACTNLIIAHAEVTDCLSLCCLGTGPGHNKYMVRLLTYLPGTPVAKIAANTELFYEIGKLAARLDKALSEVSFCCSALTKFFLK